VRDVLAALNLEEKDLFVHKSGLNISATYDYKDENGLLLYQVVRLIPKSFRQRRADGHWGLGDVRRVLYKLPEVLKAKHVLLVEGEKDADTAHRLSLCATSSGSASAKWLSEWTEILRGKRVTIIADADEPGRKHAEAVASLLHEAVIDLRVIELPGAKDLTEFVEKNKTTGKQLQEIIDKFPLWSNAAKNGSIDIECISAAAIEPEPLLWLWENRIPLGKLTVFCGPPDTGKSTVAIDIVSRVTRGDVWPDCNGHREPQDALMLISEDDLADTIVPRLTVAGADKERVYFATQTIYGEKRSERRISLETDIGALEKMLAAHPQIKIVVVDPLGSYIGKLKKNADEDMRWVLSELKEMAERMGVAVISIDHFNKNVEQSAIHRLSGAGALAAVPRAVWAFVKDAQDPEKLTRLMLNAKLNVVSEAKKVGLQYRTASKELEIKQTTVSLPVIDWRGANKSDLDEVLHEQADPKIGKLRKCVTWLEKRLTGESVLSATVYKEAQDEGFVYATVRRASEDLDVDSFQVGRRWMMRLKSGTSAREPGEE
jgi:putative DNA primase/helicase